MSINSATIIQLGSCFWFGAKFCFCFVGNVTYQIFLIWFFRLKGQFSQAAYWSDGEIAALQLCIWGIFPVVMTNALRGALEGFDRFKESGAIRGISGAATRRHRFFKLHVLLAVIMILFISLAVLISTKHFIAWWINPALVSQSLSIFYVLSIGMFANGISQVPYTFLHAMGAAKITGIIHVIEVPIYFMTLK